MRTIEQMRDDPQAGDILTRKGLSRRVTKRDGNDVWWRRGNLETCCWISTWRQWASKAEKVDDK